MIQARYVVNATWPDGSKEIVGWFSDMSEANRVARDAMIEGSIYAYSTDTRPAEPHAVTDAEREALAGIMPKMARTMG